MSAAGGFDPPQQSNLERWWMTTADEDQIACTAKMQEYGSRDLEEIGRTLARMMQLDLSGQRDRRAFYVELGIHFYEMGKLARATEAFARGELPSADTQHDKTVYSMMARAVRAGEWT